MSYLFPEGSTAEKGVVEVGSNITVLNGIISIPQSVATTATPTFASVTATTALTSPAITDSGLTAGRVTFAGTAGLLSDSANLTFSVDTLTTPKATISTSLTSPAITDSGLTAGRITFAGTGGLLSDDSDLTYNATTNTLSLPNIAVSSALTLNGASVVTSVTPTAGNGIALSSVTTSGPAAAFTVANTGVLSLIAGTGITVSGATGNVTVSATGSTIINTKGVSANYTLLATDDYVGATVGSITLTLPAGVLGQSYILKNEGGSGAVTLACTGADTIDGATTKNMNSNASITVVYRAGAWRII